MMINTATNRAEKAEAGREGHSTVIENASNHIENAEVAAMSKGKVLFLSLLVLAVSLAGGSQGYSQAPPNVQIVTGTIAQNTTWFANTVYVLRGAVFVASGATLTIEPGTLIAGEFATNGTMVVSTGGRIVANGTAAAPIVFTSDQPYGPPDWPSDDRFRADWGGLIINGFGITNVGIGFGEGGTGQFGGTNNADSSGVLRYVRVEYAGTEFSPDNELNGIAFQATGSGTIVEFIQVHMNLDDGIEFFGGATNVKYFVLTNIGDDSMDYTDGWVGKAQFGVVQQRADDADQGFEFDNNGENNNLLPRANPTIYNVTLIGDNTSVWGNESDQGMLLREGTAGRIFNCIVLDFGEVGINIDQAATITQAQQGNLVVGSTILWGNNPTLDADAQSIVNAGLWPNLAFVNPQIIRPHDWTNPDFRPALTSPAVTGAVPVMPVPAGDPFFTPVNFIGAMGPAPTDDWTVNPVKWTTSDQGFTNFFSDADGSLVVPSGRVLPNSSDPADVVLVIPPGTPGAPGTEPVLPGGGDGGSGDGDGGGDAVGVGPGCCN
jgi:hypothetical protein